jgi:hypothetical protein
MKAKQSWKFASRISEVDLQRVFREVAPENDETVIRVTINGRPYTLCMRFLAERRGLSHEIQGALHENTRVLEALFVNGAPHVAGLDTQPTPIGYPDYADVVVLFGDHVKQLVARVETVVEVF